MKFKSKSSRKSIYENYGLSHCDAQLRTMVSNVLGEPKCGCRQKAEGGKDSYVFIVHDFRHEHDTQMHKDTRTHLKSSLSKEMEDMASLKLHY